MNRCCITYRSSSFLLFLLFLLSLYSCKPAYERSCFKGAGDSDSLAIELPHFEKIILGEHMKFVLIQDTIEKVRIYGGENLLDHIKVDTDNPLELSISNDNRCRFLRYRKNEIIIYIHFKNFNELVYNGSESLTNEGVLELNDVQLTTIGTAGSINLNLNAYEIYNLNKAGWPDITLSGTCVNLRSQIFGNLILNANELVVEESINHISNSGTLSKINAEGCELMVELSGTGDLWYYGFPTEINKKEYNSGKLIDKN